MHTQTHALINSVFLGKNQDRKASVAILAGALLPDLPILLFYLNHHFILHTSEREIWTESYFLPSHWQTLTDLFHSFPLIALSFLFAWSMRKRLSSSRTIRLFFASMFLHSLFDFPVHHDDAHRHFFPFSDWKFYSPVSYWDPRYFGAWGAVLEITTSLFFLWILWRRPMNRLGRGAVLFALALYGAQIYFYLKYFL